MKLNLGCGNDIRSHGYINIDIEEKSLPPEMYRMGDVTCLDWLCEKEEVEDILAIDILQHIRHSLISDTVRNWVEKLRIGGTLKISFIDLDSVVKDFSNEKVSIEAINSILYGRQENDNDTHRSILSCCSMLLLLGGLNMKISRQLYDGHVVHIEAEKPNAYTVQ